MRRFAYLVVVGLGLLALARPAGAVIVDGTDDDFTIDFGGNIEGSDVAGLTASALFDVQSISGNTLVLSITVTNTASTSLWESARVSAFGFDTDPSITSATLASTVFSNVNLDESFPNGFGGVDVCVINNRNNCNGSRNGGLTLGQSTQLTLTLNFAQNVSAVELTNFGVRYQSLTSDELGFDGDSGTGRPGNPIPEPYSVAMFVLGGLIVATLSRKQVLTARS
jgi:hypothetical protein